MKQTRSISSLLLIFILFSCTQKKQETAVVQQDIPVILQEHPDKALFTKLTDGAGFISLFNGTDLSGWYTFTEKGGVNNDVEKEFQVEDGVLHFNGEPMGYLSTNDSYKDYYLRVVFRWGEKKYPPRLDDPRDSGILYHFPEDAENKIWPLSIECQVQENDCGDYFLVGGATADSPNGTGGRFIRTANYENPNPEWNTIEVICLDDKSEHYVNGHLVNQAYNLSVCEGKILLQLEGAEIFYKSVELLPLK
ncbi:MAG: DUF1080 domain-containing protein [Candidatus Symbiothrix sp.]|jgi:hypothetical protein|nr:DUF1080 domain-containing protein [Candidatus Symbiothrix sp.]